MTCIATAPVSRRRATKVVTENGQITSSHRFLYRGYLQIACCDRTRSAHPSLWLITWDPTQPIATRPLAIQKDGTWYTYGWNLTKNVWEAYTTTGYIGTAYTAYGQVTASGAIEQPIQWSSEYNDTELGLVYYNFRHYNPVDGRWLSRERKQEIDGLLLYSYVCNSSVVKLDLSYTAILQGDNGHALKMAAISMMDEKPFNQNTAALSTEKKCEFGVFNPYIEFTASLSANFSLDHPSNFSIDNFVPSFNLSLRHENSREGGGVNIGVTMPGFKNPSFSFSFNLKF